MASSPGPLHLITKIIPKWDLQVPGDFFTASHILMWNWNDFFLIIVIHTNFSLLHFLHSFWNLETFLQPFTCPLTCIHTHLTGHDAFPLRWALTFSVYNAPPPIALGTIRRNSRTVFSISPFSPKIFWPQNVISNVAYIWARSTTSCLIFISLVIPLLTSSLVFCKSKPWFLNFHQVIELRTISQLSVTYAFNESKCHILSIPFSGCFL